MSDSLMHLIKGSDDHHATLDRVRKAADAHADRFLIDDNPDLVKAKYISRKKVGGKWAYKYDHGTAKDYHRGEKQKHIGKLDAAPKGSQEREHHKMMSEFHGHRESVHSFADKGANSTGDVHVKHMENAQRNMKASQAVARRIESHATRKQHWANYEASKRSGQVENIPNFQEHPEMEAHAFHARARGHEEGVARGSSVPAQVSHMRALGTEVAKDGERRLMDALIPDAFRTAHPEAFKSVADNPDLVKAGGPFTGPRGGKWADAKHTIAWKEGKSPSRQRKHAHAGTSKGFHNDHKGTTVDEHGSLRHKHQQLADDARKKMRDSREGSNEHYAHKYDSRYHDSMANAHGYMAGGKNSYGGMDKYDEHSVDQSLSHARQAKREHVDAMANVESNKPPTDSKGDLHSMGKTASGKQLAFLSRENFRDHTHDWSSSDHSEAASEHRARAEHKWALSDQLQSEGKWEEAAGHNKAGRYHDQMDRVHESAALGTRSDPGDRGNKAQAEHAQSVSTPGGRVSDLVKAAPYIGPKGGKWNDPAHKVPYNEKKHEVEATSMNRHRGARGKTETIYNIHDPHAPGGTEHHTYTGRGDSPTARRSDAIRQHKERHGIERDLKHTNFDKKERSHARKQSEKTRGEASSGTHHVADGDGGFREVKTHHEAGHYAVHEVQPSSNELTMAALKRRKPKREFSVTHKPSGLSLGRHSERKAKNLADHMHEHAGDAGGSAKFGKNPSRAESGRMHEAYKKFGKSEALNSDDFDLMKSVAFYDAAVRREP